MSRFIIILKKLNYSGGTLENSFPRIIYKKAYVNNLISDDQVWINLLEDRNKISNIYYIATTYD
ncbi:MULTISPECIES: hypothetical protein [Clostridium]|nr:MULTISPECIES: hypothetical protein [Clostridium]MBY6809119.1 hypothetical protein [Clostridium botulinum]MBY6822176.1 hypothetical protein [Clostridium botulinum]MBY6833034.1 hypothetical protein [Clostridium botulinum]MBY6972262.1 hypothetical protein [Clostridium botulinum]HBJ1651105.1 hypothetical protein [Clostridium botulinum]